VNDNQRDEKILNVKNKGLKLIELYANILKTESRILMNHAAKVN
jgi:hypothetical protein